VILQKCDAQFRRVQAHQRMPAGGQQVWQAAHQAGVILFGDEAAFLVAGRIENDQVVRAVSTDLAP
jgi:hypothetical protein